MPTTTCTDCGGEVSTKAAACPHCGNPEIGAAYHDAALLEEAGLSTGPSVAVIALGAIAALLLIVIVAALASGGDRDAGRSSAVAIYNCKRSIKARLKAPSTAKFKSASTAKVKRGAIVRGYVDAQNSFGAATRSRYICHMELRGSPPEWTVERVSISSR